MKITLADVLIRLSVDHSRVRIQHVFAVQLSNQLTGHPFLRRC